MLKNIKRRSKYNKQSNGVLSSKSSSADPGKSGLESEIENLKKDQSSLRDEILSLRREQNDSQNQITAVEERIRCAECRQHQMLLFLTKTLINPNFVHQLIQKRKQKRELDGKRRRLLATGEEDLLAFQSIMTAGYLAGSVSVPPWKQTAPFETAMNEESCGGVSGSGSGSDMLSVYDVVSEDLLDDISVLDEELAVNDTKFYHELEDLIERPRHWGGYVTSFVDKTGCVASML